MLSLTICTEVALVKRPDFMEKIEIDRAPAAQQTGGVWTPNNDPGGSLFMASPKDRPIANSRAIIPPIELSTTFAREADGSYPAGYSYTRAGNPNRAHLEAALCELEGGAAAITFSSGTAASMAALMALGTGDHVLLPRESYYGTQVMVRKIFPRWGLDCEFIDMTDLAAVRAALRVNTKLIWVETPSNPCLGISDLTGITTLAKSIGAFVLCDNTFATPINQNPLSFGCDLVLHSTTKYLNGHSDVLGGVLIARAAGDLVERIHTIQVHGGGVPSPFDCWLTSRGMATLTLRVQTQCANAQIIAEFLESQPQIEKVHYPGLRSHPQFQLAQRQMRSGGGLLSFEVRGGEAAARALVAAMRRVQRATSLGGIETLIEHRASMEGPDTLTPSNLVRLAVGIEPVEEVIGDLQQAMASAR